ncbi:MAG TPA: hypothetical protein VE646_04355 [Actinomycetota bacterium]|nr:hypothetical protein [Actinomycetota bacterium]
MAHAKDKGGEKHSKRAAQKSLKERRAQKRAKRESSQHPSTVHITTTSQ